jgi:predicted nucleic acid-binding protein
VFPVTEIVTDCRDAKDNKFLALAAAVEAELIIASDPHLTDLHPWRGIPIIPPRAFLAESR